MPDGGEPPSDAYAQTKRCLEIVVQALADAGARPEDVVRTRTYLVDVADWEDVGRAHGEVFADVRPASTMVVVTGLLDPRWRVELEANAIVDERSPPAGLPLGAPPNGWQPAWVQDRYRDRQDEPAERRHEEVRLENRDDKP